MKVKHIEYDSYGSSGRCPTCNYGSLYVDDITITYEDGEIVRFVLETNSEIISESDWMVILGNSSTKEEVIEEWVSRVSRYVSDDSDDYAYYSITNGGIKTKYNVKGEIING